MSGFKPQYVNVIDTNDMKRADLKIWRDYDQDGVTDSPDSITGAGRELFTLAQLGIVELSLTNPALNVTTPTGAQLLSSGDVTFTSGRVTKMFEAIFQSSDVDTRFGGEAGVAPWANSALNVKGFGSITDLSAAMANDIELGTLATTQVAAMTAPKLKTLRAQAGCRNISEKRRRAWRKTNEWWRTGDPRSKLFLSYWPHTIKEAA